MESEQRLAALASLSLLVTMFFPWYGLQSLNPKTKAIYSHNISAFGDVSFVEAAIFLVAAGVTVLLIARAEGREFHMPGGDGTVVAVAGAWATLLIFYRVFSRPSGDGYPVGIEWGFFLAFVAAGTLAFVGWRMRASERPAPPATRPRSRRSPAPTEPVVRARPSTPVAQPAPSGPPQHRRSRPVPAREANPFPPAPPEQLSFEDPPTQPE
jgi:hypothetical protein